MVSSIDSSTRLISAQLALKAIKEQEKAAEGTTKRTALLNRFGLGTAGSAPPSLNATLNRLLSEQAEKQAGKAQADSKTAAPSESAATDDISTADFMKSLKAELKTLGAAAATATQAKAMLAALETGALTVTDPLKGVEIAAWDVDAKAAKGVVSKKPAAIATADWSDFLKACLKREDGAAYAKKPAGQLYHTATGKNAFFGTVGDRYYYLTWTPPKAATPQAGSATGR